MKALTWVVGFWGFASLALAGEQSRVACADISGVWEPIGECEYSTTALPKTLASLKLRKDDQLVFTQIGCAVNDIALEKPFTVADPVEPEGGTFSFTGYYFWDQNAAFVGTINTNSFGQSPQAPYSIDQFVVKWSLDSSDKDILNEETSGTAITHVVAGNLNTSVSLNVTNNCRYHRVAGR